MTGNMDPDVSKWLSRALYVSALSLFLALLGLIVGVSCVVLPQAAPLGLLGATVLLLLWVLPDLQAVPERASKWLTYLQIITSISIPAYFAIILPGMPWISIRRVALFSFVGVLCFTIAASSKIRKALYETASYSRPLMYVTTSYFLLSTLTILISPRPIDSANIMFNSAMTWWLPLVAVLIVVKQINQVRILFLIVVSSMFFDMIMGIIETRLRGPFLIYFLPASMRAEMLSRFPMYIGMLTGGLRNGIYRAVSTYFTGLSWGEMAAMTGPLAAHFLMHEKSMSVRAFGGASLAGCLYSIYMSGSRGAYVGFTAAMIIYFALSAIRHMRTRPESIIGGITLVLYSMFSVAVILAILFVGTIHRLVLGGGEVQASNDGRSLEWALAMPKIYSSPIWGHGIGMAADVVGFYNQAGNPTLDSYIINVLVDTGVLGLLLFSGIILGSAILCLKNYVTNPSEEASFCGAIGSALIAYSLYRLTLSQTENNTLAFMLVGLTFVSNRIIRVKKIDTKNNERNRPSGLASPAISSIA